MGPARGGNGGDAITKPVRPGAGRTAPPWAGEALHHAGPWEVAWRLPTAGAPAALAGEGGVRGEASRKPRGPQSHAPPCASGTGTAGQNEKEPPKSPGARPRVERVVEASHAIPPCSTQGGAGLGLFTRFEGAETSRRSKDWRGEGRRRSRVIKNKTFRNLKSLN